MQIGTVSVSSRQSTPVWAVVVMVLVAAARESTFFFCSLALCLSQSQSLSDQSDSWGEECRADFVWNGHGSPHLLHVLQVDVIVGLGVVFILVVVATVALAEGKEAYG